MILELDMGNTRIKWRLRNDSSKVAHGSFPSSASGPELASSLQVLTNASDGGGIVRVLVSSVLGDERNEELRALCSEYFSVVPEFATSVPLVGGVSNGYGRPESLGIDRWLAVLAGFASARRACVIVDCGSALTVDLVNSGGEYLGGYIAPGLKLMRLALRNTHGVRVNDLPGHFSLNPGKDTEACVTGAQSAMVCGLVEHALEQMHDQGPLLILTGGDAGLLLARFPAAQIKPDLVLDGLSLALPVC